MIKKYKKCGKKCFKNSICNRCRALCNFHSFIFLIKRIWNWKYYFDLPCLWTCYFSLLMLPSFTALTFQIESIWHLKLPGFFGCRLFASSVRQSWLFSFWLSQLWLCGISSFPTWWTKLPEYRVALLKKQSRPRPQLRCVLGSDRTLHVFPCRHGALRHELCDAQRWCCSTRLSSWSCIIISK